MVSVSEQTGMGSIPVKVEWMIKAEFDSNSVRTREPCST